MPVAAPIRNAIDEYRRRQAYKIHRYFPDCQPGCKPESLDKTDHVGLCRAPTAEILYLYSVYKRSAAEPVIHAEAIKARGAWMHGVGDCAALIMTDEDAEQLIHVYRRLGLKLTLPDKAVETGIQECWELLSTGRVKVFASCEAWFEEYRFYRRDEKGRIVKKNDHVMDAMRYLLRSGRPLMKTKPSESRPIQQQPYQDPNSRRNSWMGG